MDPASSSQFVILFVLFMLSAFFSASETALMSLSKIRLRTMVDENVKNAEIIQEVLENPSRLISAILIGNNLVNIGASSLATSIAINMFGNKGVGIATGLLTLFVLIFGEITPKTLATQKAEKLCILVIKPIKLCIFIFTPVIVVLNVITGFLLKLLKCDPAKKEPAITESELLTMVNVSHEEGVLEVDEREMISNVVDFGNSDAKDIMTPRTDMVAVPIDSTYEEIENVFVTEQFSRIPVYKENIDDIVGIIYFKDFIFSADKDNFDINSLLREPYYTYESNGCRELFSQMRAKGMYFAIILDEYGGTSGIVTLEDLFEEIVGDISDEFDDEDKEIEIIKENEYIVDGSAKISDVNEMIGTNFESDDFDSIGGYVIGVIGRFPKKGETIETNDIKFIVEEIDKNRIEKLRIFI